MAENQWMDERDELKDQIDALTAERDALRAELAAAKAKMQEGEGDCRFCRDLEGDSKYPCTCGWTYGALATAYGNALQERTALCAELAAAKERGDGLYLGLRQTLEALGGVAQPGVSEAFLILGVPGEAAAIKQLNVALAAHVERLVGALEAARPYISMVLDEKKEWLNLENKLAITSDAEAVHTALAATPDQSLAAHDAALLREVADREFNPEQSAEERWAHGVLHGNADRIAKEVPHACLLAAQALEALAWAEKQKQPIECVLGKWRILGRDQYGHLKYYYADTPFGALLAAMEGESDGKEN